MSSENAAQEAKVPNVGVRGMSYPAISLKEAVSRTSQLWEREHKNAAPIEAIASHWGYSPASSGVRTTVAALLSFGLVVGIGSGQQRSVRITDRGLDIVLDTPQRESALREAMIGPRIYAELLNLWPAQNLPSDQAIKVHLLRNKNFNPKSVEGFIKDFRESVTYSGMAEAGNMTVTDTSEVRPMQDASVDRRPTTIPATPTAPPTAYWRDVSSSGQDVEWWSGALSSEVQCRVLASGPITPKALGKLIKLLEAQKAVLSEDDDD